MHADPLGFCWESSLPRMVFRSCTDRQRLRAREIREAWLAFERKELPPMIRKPFVLWPLQLTGDQVNHWDLRLEDWTGLIRHFRECLPDGFQLVLKEHPRSKPHDHRGVAELARELPETVLLPHGFDLKTLLAECSAVAGANSSVLHEARLMFHKPACVYARSWFTNHEELFIPMRQHHVREPNRFEFVEDNRLLRTERLDDYTDWFLAQLLARQIDRETAVNPQEFKERVYRLSYQSFIQHGEDIFA
jgi:hypothetical protein